jgi:hypothetical protein
MLYFFYTTNMFYMKISTTSTGNQIVSKHSKKKEELIEKKLKEK